MKKRFPVGKLKSALLAVRPKISEPQMSMLRAHYLYRTLPMERIAHFGGYGSYRSGNLQYGLLCGRIARELGFETPGNQTYTVASVMRERDAKGQYQWRMNDEVAAALEGLGWVSEVAKEKPLPSKSTKAVTQRETLIKARIGQGIFRTDVIALWGSCAVTGCTLSKIPICLPSNGLGRIRV